MKTEQSCSKMDIRFLYVFQIQYPLNDVVYKVLQ